MKIINVMFTCSVGLLAFATSAETLTVDFGAQTGKIRPELHSSGFGPMICSYGEATKSDIKSMNFKFARTHDWALINKGERVCDYYHMFPLFHLDAKDPSNYVFGPTDYLLQLTREGLGEEIFFRLGASIEHSGEKVHFNALMPSDFDKVAEVFAGTVRHYNQGWANGFNWDIKYWEIWNEPDGWKNMWCPPEGTAGLTGKELAKKQEFLKREFVRFYVTVLKRLKAEFGDSIKVGGPALRDLNVVWIKELLKACKAEGVAPDFISWHDYIDDPMQINREAETARKICDSFGFKKCELIVNEWHYLGRHYGWSGLRSSDSAVRTKAVKGPYGHNGIHSTAFTLATLINLQRSELSQAYFYGCSHVGSWGYKDELAHKYKVYYGLKLFGDIVRDYTEICASESKGEITTFAVKNDAGKKALLVADYGGRGLDYDFEIKGVDASAKVECTVLDNTHDLTEYPVEFKEGQLHFRKKDHISAAFLIKFD